MALNCALDSIFGRIPQLDRVVVRASREFLFALRIGANCINRVFMHVFLATFERDDGMNLWNAKVATVLILHVNFLYAVLKGHFVLNFWVFFEAEGRSVIHFFA